MILKEFTETMAPRSVELCDREPVPAASECLKTREIRARAWPPGGPGEPCQCKKRICEGTATRAMKYIQPKRPKSFAPRSVYLRSDYPLEAGTTYKLSYMGVDGDMARLARGPAVAKPPDNVKPCQDPMSQDTTFRLSFMGTPAPRVASYKPVMRSMMGAGPLHSVTTQKHDYTPKMAADNPKMPPPPNNIRLSDLPLSGVTTFNASYQPVEAAPTQSYKPRHVYVKPEYKLEDGTINRLSYQPWQPTPKEELPWARKATYKQPCHPLDGKTIYRCSYRDNENWTKPSSYAPRREYIKPQHPLEAGTTYKLSYMGVDGDTARLARGPAVAKPPDNVKPCHDPMSQDTTFRLSFMGTPAPRVASYKPVMRSMMGAGPLHSVTTQKHDYTPKMAADNPKMPPPPNNIRLSDLPLSGMTTFNASYQPVEAAPTQSYKPRHVYVKPEYKLEDGTINRLSYQPWQPTPKEELPWARKATYKQPCHPLDGGTIYRGSYVPPGNFMQDPCSTAVTEGTPCYCTQPGACLATEGL